MIVDSCTDHVQTGVNIHQIVSEGRQDRAEPQSTDIRAARGRLALMDTATVNLHAERCAPLSGQVSCDAQIET